MNWVDSRYISVDNGILTFKAPPSAVVPAVSEDTAKKKEKKPKENWALIQTIDFQKVLFPLVCYL